VFGGKNILQQGLKRMCNKQYSGLKLIPSKNSLKSAKNKPSSDSAM
jgi:hypothetical protein